MLLLVLGTGCLYADPINQPPSADIVQDPVTTIARGGTASFKATTRDPDGQPVTVRWRVYACTDAATPAGCDAKPFQLGVDDLLVVNVPVDRAHVPGEQDRPVESLRVILEATDSLGATAKPAQELLVPVVDAPPTLVLHKMSSYGYVVHTPVDIYAEVTDPDDLNDALTWTVSGPATADSFDSLPQSGKQLVVSTPGEWDVQVQASDRAGGTASQHETIEIVPDHAPCLTSWAPLDAPPGQTVPLADPTLFEVLTVTDDLDPYPPVTGDPLRGTPSFAWSILPPGASQRESLGGVIGNSVALDPASYNAGDIVELRVEIQDRNHFPVDCVDSDPTCSVISDPTCIQRLTWRIEVQ